MKAMKIGFTAGNFDCMHPGYIAMFRQMKEECETVWVLLQTDPTIERPEKMKPILSTEERMEMLLALRDVDHVMTYTTEADLREILEGLDKLRTIFVRFLGDDYIDKSFTGDDLDIPIRYLNRDHGWSTTKYKKQIADEVLRSSNI